MSKAYMLGIDLGTTNIKGMVLDQQGQIMATASRQNDLILPGANMVEQDAGIWWQNAREIIRELTSAAGQEIVRHICGISISSQTVTLLPVDKSGRPLRNAIIWMDGRSEHELSHIIRTMGFDRFVSIVGGQPDAAFLPNKILWYKNHEPELFDKTYRILQASSYINYMLTGQMTMDMDQASRTQCLDINTLQWSDDIAQVIGVDFHALLPQPRPVNEVIGTVTARAAAETGLISGIPVTAGASDAMASMYAMGLSRLGEAGESSGTSSLLFLGHNEASAPNLPLVTKPCAIPGMPYIFDAPISTSGAAIKWYLDNLGAAEREYAKEHQINVFTHLNQLALEARAGSGGVLFFPYLMGERAPLWNSYSRGMLIGMSLRTERKELVRSVFEGTAFALRHVLDTVAAVGAKADCLKITGGGAKSETWSQIKASVLNMPVQILDEKSSDVAFGDALLAGQAMGIFPDLSKSIGELIQVQKVIEPVAEWVDVYDGLYPFYIEMYQKLDEELRKLNSFMKTVM